MVCHLESCFCFYFWMECLTIAACWKFLAFGQISIVFSHDMTVLTQKSTCLKTDT